MNESGIPPKRYSVAIESGPIENANYIPATGTIKLYMMDGSIAILRLHVGAPKPFDKEI